MSSYVVLASIALLAIATAAAFGWLARRLKRRLQILEEHEAARFAHLEGRIDELAARTFETATGQDHRLDALTTALDELASKHHADHLLALITAAQDDGRLGRTKARALTRQVLHWRDQTGADA